MKDKSKIGLVAVIIIVAAIIAYVCYGISNGNKKPIATMEVSYKDSEGNIKNGIVKMELNPDVAPESVSNFITLANNGFYDGLTFHRIVDNFMIQGGDKKGDGSGSANYSDLFKTYEVTKIENKKATCKDRKSLTEQEINMSKLPKGTEVGDVIWYKDGKYQKNITDYVYSIKGEFAANGINNNLRFEKGVVGMSRSDFSSYGMTEQGYNSASSQFFITVTEDKSTLNGLNQKYASFGKVIEGYEYVEEIAKLYAEKKADDTTVASEENSSGETATDEGNSEEVQNEEDNTPKIVSIRVETYGADYGIPNVINYESTLNEISQYQSYYNQLLNSYQQESSDVDTESIE